MRCSNSISLVVEKKVFLELNASVDLFFFLKIFSRATPGIRDVPLKCRIIFSAFFAVSRICPSSEHTLKLKLKLKLRLNNPQTNTRTQPHSTCRIVFT